MSDATNLQAFQTAVAVCAGQGADYQPSNASIESTHIQLALTAAQSAVSDFVNANIAEKLVINDREEGFAGSGALATRLQAAVEACGASANDVEDMKGFVRKVHGGRAKKLAIDDPSTPEDESKHISVSQRGYSDVVQHYTHIIQLLTSLGAQYGVNEPDLQIAAIQAKVDDWTTLNQAVIDAGVVTDNARSAKNGLLYDNDDSLYERLRIMKLYFKQAFGATSDQYKQLSGLVITKPGKR
jgi:hypothetical protein